MQAQGAGEAWRTCWGRNPASLVASAAAIRAHFPSPPPRTAEVRGARPASPHTCLDCSHAASFCIFHGQQERGVVSGAAGWQVNAVFIRKERKERLTVGQNSQLGGRVMTLKLLWGERNCRKGMGERVLIGLTEGEIHVFKAYRT